MKFLQDAATVQIVIAYTEAGIEVLDTFTTARGDGINAVSRTKEIVVPHAAMWLRRGTSADVKKAEAHAATTGATVFTYPTSERDPLGRAKSDILNVTR